MALKLQIEPLEPQYPDLRKVRVGATLSNPGRKPIIIKVRQIFPGIYDHIFFRLQARGTDLELPNPLDAAPVKPEPPGAEHYAVLYPRSSWRFESSLFDPPADRVRGRFRIRMFYRNVETDFFVGGSFYPIDAWTGTIQSNVAVVTIE